jgi:hypothetical protein
MCTSLLCQAIKRIFELCLGSVHEPNVCCGKPGEKIRSCVSHALTGCLKAAEADGTNH